ncbi:MAG: DUF4115 domain-containing protein [Rhodospirillales bacterium]|nr:DUF4115 domain-containing protein [Alphaproteobacteria bacterium]USO03162.1 MAG: DUF4115 domain-containing protein [Rhodospirillales bacterium]
MNQPAPAHQVFESDMDFPVGEILRHTRLQYGQSLQQVEVALRIRAAQLYAIEEGRLENLPGRVYAIGFVRSYAEYLGLDGDRIVRMFKAQFLDRRPAPELHFPVAPSEGNTPGLYAVLGGVAGLVLLLAVWSVFYRPGFVEKAVPSVPEILKQSPLTEAPAIAIETEVKAPKIPKKEPPRPAENPYPDNRVVLEVQEDSWIQIRQKDGGTLLQRVLKKGDVYLVPNEEGLLLTTGNAGGFVVKIDGKETLRFGKSAQVRRKISLNPEDLLGTNARKAQ